MRIYISGPMSNITNFNSSAFSNAEKKLRDAGHFPINPIAVDAANGDTYETERTSGVWISTRRQEYLLRDLAIIMSTDDPIDAIYMLQGWEKSNGARIEHAVACQCGKHVYQELSGGRLPSGLDMLGPSTWPHERSQVHATAGPAPDHMSAREFLRSQPAPGFGGYSPFDAEFTQKAGGALKQMNETILQEAQRLVHGARGEAYGHPLDDFTRTAAMLNALGFVRNHDHGNKCMVVGAPLSAEDIAIVMICVKLSRERNTHKRDNLVDICGYAETLSMVHDERKRRASEQTV